MAALKLRMLRIDRGLSRTALAERVGVAPHTITRLEEGERPSESTALKVAGFFDLKPTELWPELVQDREVPA